jgi:hypothetical protein
MSTGRLGAGDTAIQPTILDAKGDLIVATAADTPARLAVGSSNQTLLADSAQATGIKWGSSPQSLMTATGDLLYASSANTPARLGIGSSGQALTVSGGVPAWTTLTSGFVGCSAYSDRGTSLTNGATTYALNMNAENFDTDNFHDNTTNNTRITIPSGKGGKYQVNIKVSYDNASGAPGYINLFLRINGSGTWNIASGSQISMNTNGGATGNNNNTILAVSNIVNFSAGDYFEVMSRTDNGNGTLAASPLVSVVYLGA